MGKYQLGGGGGGNPGVPPRINPCKDADACAYIKIPVMTHFLSVISSAASTVDVALYPGLPMFFHVSRKISGRSGRLYDVMMTLFGTYG